MCEAKTRLSAADVALWKELMQKPALDFDEIKKTVAIICFDSLKCNCEDWVQYGTCLHCYAAKILCGDVEPESHSDRSAYKETRGRPCKPRACHESAHRKNKRPTYPLFFCPICRNYNQNLANTQAHFKGHAHRNRLAQLCFLLNDSAPISWYGFTVVPTADPAAGTQALVVRNKLDCLAWLGEIEKRSSVLQLRTVAKERIRIASADEIYVFKDQHKCSF